MALAVLRPLALPAYHILAIYGSTTTMFLDSSAAGREESCMYARSRRTGWDGPMWVCFTQDA
eukprot:5507247-Pleurochrysis_carterae.AAC.1